MYSIILHEIAHGFVARLFGDNTAYNYGRLTLNPLKHLDPIGTIILPLVLLLSGSSFVFGWAKPVPINPRAFNDYRKGMIWTAVAGPLTNITIATFFSAIIKNIPLAEAGYRILAGVITINLFLAFFNLLPIPPLDGSRVIRFFLSSNLALKYDQLEKYGFLIIFGLIYLGIIDYLLLFLIPLIKAFL